MIHHQFCPSNLPQPVPPFHYIPSVWYCGKGLNDYAKTLGLPDGLHGLMQHSPSSLQGDEINTQGLAGSWDQVQIIRRL